MQGGVARVTHRGAGFLPMQSLLDVIRNESSEERGDVLGENGEPL
jgi:hypothetical protein